MCVHVHVQALVHLLKGMVVQQTSRSAFEEGLMLKYYSVYRRVKSSSQDVYLCMHFRDPVVILAL